MNTQTVIDRESGFALVDLLTGIAVAGLAGSILVSLVAFVGRNNSDMEQRNREYAETFAVERILHTLVAGSASLLPGTSKASGIGGTEHTMEISSTGLPIFSYPRSTTFVLTQEAKGTGSGIILLWKDEVGQRRREIILRNASGLSFSYLPSGDGSPEAAGWRSHWRSEDGSLSAVKITFRTSSAPAIRTIVVPIHVSLPAFCLRNPRQPGCTVEGE